MKSRTRKPFLRVASIGKTMAAALILALTSTLAFPLAAEPTSPPPTAVETTVSPAQRNARYIRDLVAGRLGLDIDARRLFDLPLGTADAIRTRAVLAMIEDPALFSRARDNNSVLAGLSNDQAALAVAQAEFLRLPRSRRQALLEKHRKIVETASQEKRNAAQAQEKIAVLKRTEAALRAFLAGQRADPAALSIDALDISDSVQSAPRRAILLDLKGSADGEHSHATSPQNDEPEAITRRIDDLRAQLLALPADERARLVALQANGPSPSQVADDAARQAAAASLAADQAGNETQRLLATERAKLLRVREAQARAEALLTTRRADGDQALERALGWRRQVRELLDRPRSDTMKAVDADSLYLQLVDALKSVRGELRTALGRASALDDAKLTPPQTDDALGTSDALVRPLVKLHNDLSNGLARLHGLEDAIRANQREALFNAMIDMNEVRLSLIPALSGPMRSRITGFGEEGFAQVRREINQMMLTLRYTIVSGPKRVSAALQPLLHPTPQLVLSLLRLALVALAFQYWRRRGDGMLALAERSNAGQRPPTLVSTGLALGISYLRKVRGPLDWLIFLIILHWLLPMELDLTGLRFAWLIAEWVLLTALLVRLLDALAQGRRADDPRAALRQTSLRLVAGVILCVGLILSLTDQSVGKGAIYSWVFSACWVLLLPLTLILASWWRERILMLSQAAGPASPLLAWSARNQQGIFGNLARVIAGIVLMFAGARAIIVRRVNEFALIRELSDQRQRARAAARVAADAESGRFGPVQAEKLEILGPHRGPLTADPAKRTAVLSAMPAVLPGAILALVGERGLGKSTMLDDLAHGIGGHDTVIRISVVANGFDSICAQLANCLETDPEPEILCKKLGVRGGVVMVDDLQRLVVPAIGGLADFDRLVALARATSPGTSWIFAIGSPAWSYLNRARGDRTIFDKVVLLPRWEVSDLRMLIERRTAQAGIDPIFDPLESAGLVTLDVDLSPEERTKRAYFTELADYSAGNPAVALEFWRRSLFLERGTDKIVVRTYRTPDTDALAMLPQNAIFVLRTILQMEMASLVEIQRCTDLGSVIVSDATHVLERMGVIAPYVNGYRVTLFWYREVRRLLERQNMLGRTAA